MKPILNFITLIVVLLMFNFLHFNINKYSRFTGFLDGCIGISYKLSKSQNEFNYYNKFCINYTNNMIEYSVEQEIIRNLMKYLIKVEYDYN